MALQSSGAISLSEIATEFGGTAPHALSEYYGVASGVPGSGTIAFSDFHGTTSFAMGGGRGVFLGGDVDYSDGKTIDYVDIASTGNATNFGDLLIWLAYGIGTASNGSRGVTGGGSPYMNDPTMQYITIGSPGNASDFGDFENLRNAAGVSSGTRGVFAGGRASTSVVNELDYITISTTGNATNFGSLSVTRFGATGASNETRGLFGGGKATQINPVAGTSNVIDYITIASTGTATDFGDLSVTRGDAAGVSSLTRAVFCGGALSSSGAWSVFNTMDYVAIASTGNATDFGDLTNYAKENSGTSNGTRGIMCMGLGGTNVYTAYSYKIGNTIEYITIASTGNATDFGDRTTNIYAAGSGATSGG
jgi:hypothetical protein